MKNNKIDEKQDYKIDVVILWVDGNDPVWREKKRKYTPDSELLSDDSRECRYRDWGTLKYLLRGIDYFMPWVNKIFLITDNQRPEWLKESDRLRLVDHKDYIPDKYLPTFNSNTIELNLHRINELSERFIIFNDDMFAIRPLEPTDFFKDGKPRDQAILKPIDPRMENTESCKTKLLMASIINKHFTKKEVIRNNPRLWYSLKYGKRLYSNIALYPYNYFPGFYDNHIPISHLKSTFCNVWEKEYEALDSTCLHKTRNYADNVSHWLFRYWNLAAGTFEPRGEKIGSNYGYGVDNSAKIYSAILNQSFKLICINDAEKGFDFDIERKNLINAFESILPNKSSFEK